MSVITAQVIAGNADMYRDGLEPLNVLWFTEGGSRPSWYLERASLLDRFEQSGPEDGGVGPAAPVTLVPEQPETILEDGLLLLVARGIADASVVTQAEDLLPELLESTFVDLGLGKHNPDDLVELRDLSADCETGCQLTVILFQGFTLYEQLPVLERYPFNLEVCTPTYSRQKTPWHPETIGYGSIDTRPPIVNPWEDPQP